MRAPLRDILQDLESGNDELRMPETRAPLLAITRELEAGKIDDHEALRRIKNFVDAIKPEEPIPELTP